jgi:hypothetical protein
MEGLGDISKTPDSCVKARNELGECYCLSTFRPQKRAAIFNEAANKLCYQLIRELQGLPGIYTVLISEALIQTVHR